VANRSKVKGTAAESAVARYLSHAGWAAERRALSGTQDRGDITGVLGVTIEVKSRNGFFPSEWVDELMKEMMNDGTEVGFVVAKRRGTTDPGEWFCILPLSIMVGLLQEGGY
jgi:hypothetical protein